MNTRKIEPGMVCMVVGHKRDGCPHIGRFVTVVRKVQPGEQYHSRLIYNAYATRDAWLCKGEDVYAWSEFTQTWVNFDNNCFHFPEHLIPVVPPEEQLQYTSLKTIKVPSDAKELTAT